MRLTKYVLFGLTPVVMNTCLATPITMHLIALTPFKANIINNTGQSLYLAQGSPNDPHKLNNPLLCPVFASQQTQQALTWNLNGISFPASDPSPDIEVALYLAPSGSASTSASKQSEPCPTDLTKATPVKCINTDGYIKDGTIKFSTYGTQPLLPSPVVSITGYNATNHTATCSMNTYSYITAPPAYRQLNVGENYLPLGAGSKGGATRTTPLLDMNRYIAGFNASALHPRLPVNYVFNGGTANPIIGNASSLLLLKNEELFVQHNVSADWLSACLSSQQGCEPLTHNGKTIPNKYVVWTPVNATLIKGPKPNNTFTYSTTFPVIISNAIRAKTVSELVNQRMLWLVQHNKIQDNATAALKGVWLAHNSTQPNQAQLAPDGADPVVSDPHDYLAIALRSTALVKATNATPIVNLSQYFVMPHSVSGQKIPTTKVMYQLSANHLTINPNLLKTYGITTTQKTTDYPIAKITGIHVDGSTNPVSYLTGHDSLDKTAGDFTSASNSSIAFAIDNTTLTAKALPGATTRTLGGVYQINVKATNTSTGNSAYTTFYVYISDNTANTLANWNAGNLPTLRVLSYQPNHPFGSAYLYTSYDFTKSYEQKPWKQSMTTLFSDLQTANTQYKANVKTAFIDVNNLSFANNMGYWPLTGVTGTEHYDVLNSISPSGLVTNLAQTHDSKTSLLGSLATFFSSQASKGVNAALTAYPSNSLKAAFAGFNPQQRNDFADITAAPMLYKSSNNPFSGISVDFEGGLNSVGDTQFYKLLSDKLAYRGKWFSYFYFTTMVTPSFVESIGPLGALEVSTYDVGTYRTPTKTATVNGANYSQGINPGLGNTIALQDQGWSAQDINALYTTYANDKTCNLFKSNGKSATDTSVSWCNNSANQSISENNRMWKTFVKASFQYGSPQETMQFFHGKFQLVLPVSWSATQWTHLYVWNPDFSQAFAESDDLLGSDINTWKSGLFMVNKNAKAVCTAAQLSQGNADLKACLLGDLSTVNDSSVQPYKVLSDSLIQISSLPSTIPTITGNTTSWSQPATTSQADYMNANMWVYRDMLDSPSMVGLSAYALQLYEAAPSNVKAVVVNHQTNMASLQLPWYVGFDKTDAIPGSTQNPGYSLDTSKAVWETFGKWMSTLDNTQ